MLQIKTILKKILKNSYLFLLLTLLTGKIILFLSELLTLFYEELIFKFFPKIDWMILLVELSSFIFITGLVVFWGRKIQKLSWETFGFMRKNALKHFLKGWLLGGIVLSLCVILMIFLGAVKIDGIQISPQLICRFFFLFFAWSIQGNAEEVLTRGWLFGGISKKINIFIGILISSSFFTWMHLENDGISLLSLLDLFLFGIFAVLYRIKTENIWGISGFHAAWNCFQGNVFSFPVSGTDTGSAFISVTTQGPSWLSGGKFGVEGSIVSIVVQLILIFYLYYEIFIKGKKNMRDQFVPEKFEPNE